MLAEMESSFLDPIHTSHIHLFFLCVMQIVSLFSFLQKTLSNQVHQSLAKGKEQKAGTTFPQETGLLLHKSVRCRGATLPQKAEE